MPKFSGGTDPEDYLSWALKVDKIFRLHNYEEEKKIAMASLEFDEYVLIWWEQVIERRSQQGRTPYHYLECHEGSDASTLRAYTLHS